MVQLHMDPFFITRGLEMHKQEQMENPARWFMQISGL